MNTINDQIIVRLNECKIDLISMLAEEFRLKNIIRIMEIKTEMEVLFSLLQKNNFLNNLLKDIGNSLDNIDNIIIDELIYDNALKIDNYKSLGCLAEEIYNLEKLINML